MKYLYELRKSDIDKTEIVVPNCCTCGCPHGSATYSLEGVIGRVLPCDVGKRLWLVDGILQIENEQQFEARIEKEKAK